MGKMSLTEATRPTYDSCCCTSGGSRETYVVMKWLQKE